MQIDTTKETREKPLSTPLVADETNTIHFKPPTPPRQYGIYYPAKDFLDREERAIANLLSRFKNLVSLAAMPALEGDGAAKEVAASHAFQMEVESNALVQAAEDLLQLTRELKEMWLAGPLRDIKEDEEDGEMGEDASKVAEMVDEILKRASELREGAAVGLQ